MCDERKPGFGVLKVVGEIVIAKFNVKADAWPGVSQVLINNFINYSGPISYYRKGVNYKVFEFTCSWANYFKIRLAVNKTQQERLKKVGLQLEASIY